MEAEVTSGKKKNHWNDLFSDQIRLYNIFNHHPKSLKVSNYTFPPFGKGISLSGFIFSFQVPRGGGPGVRLCVCVDLVFVWLPRVVVFPQDSSQSALTTSWPRILSFDSAPTPSSGTNGFVFWKKKKS